MKVTKEYLRKLIKESIQSLNEEDYGTFYLIIDEGWGGGGMMTADTLEKAKENALYMEDRADDPHDSEIAIYKVSESNKVRDADSLPFSTYDYRKSKESKKTEPTQPYVYGKKPKKKE